MGEAVQPAPAARRVHYERRRPEDTVLYQVVQEHLENFLAQVELAAIEDPPVIAKILTHLGLSARAPPRSPARPFDRFQMAF